MVTLMDRYTTSFCFHFCCLIGRRAFSAGVTSIAGSAASAIAVGERGVGVGTGGRDSPTISRVFSLGISFIIIIIIIIIINFPRLFTPFFIDRSILYFSSFSPYIKIL